MLGVNNNPANQADLQAQLGVMTNTRIGYNLRNFAGYNPNLAQQPPPSRYGRLDAVGAIVNEVYFHASSASSPTSAIAGRDACRCSGRLPFPVGHASA